VIPLDNRLSCIAEAAGRSECIADIGSDHALIAVSLLLSKNAKRAIAIDINQGPLDRGKSTAQKYGVTDIEFVLSDGFERLREGSYDKAVVCGMGGSLIAEIIRRGGSKAHCPLVLQPMTAYEELRSYLWNNGFRIDNESFAVESDKPYVIINCSYTGKNEFYTYTDLYLGKVRPNTLEFLAFCKKICASAQKRHKGALHKGISSRHVEDLIAECYDIINK